MNLRTCLACGAESRDVAMRLVWIKEPAEQRVVQVALVSSEDQRGVKGLEYSDVREQYVNEPRCRDTTACGARVSAIHAMQATNASADHAEPIEPDPPPPPDAVDLTPSWMRPD